MSRKRWLVYPHDPAAIANLEQTLGVSPLLAQLLLRRKLTTPQVARTFLDPKLPDLLDPSRLPGVPLAADLIFEAARRGQKIVIYGDYDADGMTATAILLRCVEHLGASATYFVPNRLDDGYGLNIQAIESLQQRGAQMLVTVDCGINSLDCAKRAKELGLQLVITDHHQIGEALPDADAIVHPALPGEAYPFEHLCGAAVALKLAWRICQLASNAERVTTELRDFLMQALGLAAIGTICDVVPLIGENRILVRYGLTALRSHPCLGVNSLLSTCQLAGDSALSAEDIAFTLGPRLNAAGRLGQAQLGVELLTTESPPRAEALAEYLQQLNQSRDSLDRSVYLGANKLIKEHHDAEADSAFVLADRNWHAGVIGLVAGRIAEKYHRPTLLISLDPTGNKSAMGSGRSVGVVDLYAALESCRDHLLSFGGHAAAAGFKIDEGCIDDFREAFCEYVLENVDPADRMAELHLDVETLLGQLTLEAMAEIEKLAPFGQSNPRPLFCATGVELTEPPKVIGSGNRHLSLRIAQHDVRMRAVAFGHADWAVPLQEWGQPIDVAFRPAINEFRGYRRVELQMVDWRPSVVPAIPETS